MLPEKPVKRPKKSEVAKRIASNDGVEERKSHSGAGGLPDQELPPRFIMFIPTMKWGGQAELLDSSTGRPWLRETKSLVEASMDALNQKLQSEAISTVISIYTILKIAQ